MTPTRSRRAALALTLAAAGCGTLAPDGNAVGQLPSSGAGPYRPLEQQNPLLSDRSALLDDAVLRVDGEILTVHFTRRDEAGRATIGRARWTSLEADAPMIETALGANRPFEGGGVSQPALLDLGDGHTLLAYATAAGAIGCAVSDGEALVKWAGAVRLPEWDQGQPLSSPALLLLDDDRVRLVYLAGGVPLAADATRADLVARADLPFGSAAGLPIQLRDPSLAALGRTTARTVVLSTGRRRHDLFFTRPGAVRSLGFAGSFDGADFLPRAEALLDAKAPEEWAPSGAAWRGGTLLVYTRTLAARTVLHVAASP